MMVRKTLALAMRSAERAVVAFWMGLAPLAFGMTARAQSGDPSELPQGHPALGDSNPHAHANGAGASLGVFQPPEDTEQADPALPPGSIAVELRDPDDKPIPREVVTLGILVNSIAKGDSRKHMQQSTDAAGRTLFSGLETAGNIAYRVSAGYQGGSFAASPFQLQNAHAMRVVLHVYPVARNLQGAVVVCEATVAAELRDDRLQLEEALTIYNLGRTAWQPDDVRLALPEGFTAFTMQTSMTDQGVDETGGAAKLRGTFAPGQHTVDFRWQIPWSGDKDVDFDVGLPPHVAIARVMMPSSGQVKLDVAGFPPAQMRTNGEGQSFLVAERHLRPDDGALTALSIGVRNLPTPGPGRLIATFLAALGVCTGVFIAVSRRHTKKTVESDRSETLLAELADLERARRSGNVGPQTYERGRRELIDLLARSLTA